MKTCRVCKIDKEHSEYFKDRSRFDGLRGVCKVCDSKRRKELGYSKFPLRIRDSKDSRHRFKIEEGVYYEMYNKQKGCCAVCSKPSHRLCVDHCHNTGTIRALLCHGCNTALGLMKENPNAILSLYEFAKQCNVIKEK